MDLKGLEALQPVSCLSPKVKHIICNMDKQVLRVADPNCLTLDGFINWKEMEEILLPTNEDTEEYFLQATQQLLPVSRRVKMELEAASAEKQVLFSTNLQWMSAPERPRVHHMFLVRQMLRRCLRLLEEDSEPGLILSLLVSTAVLERSLGDVFLLRGSPCPCMLKDLLVTNELREIFGTTPMQLLQVIIGRPMSLNLRNVTWHGFVSPGEIPTHFAWLLLSMTSSLGTILMEQGICLKDIPHRPPITFPQADQLEHVFPDIAADELPLLRLLHEESMFMPTTMQSLWDFTLDTFAESRYGECVVMLLPQLEHGMRRLYCVANSCQERLLTAESTVLFTTFDEILSPAMSDGYVENKLRGCVGDECITLLLDLLTYPEGPRLRDAISHGEVDLESCPRVLARCLLGVCSSFYLLALRDDSTLGQESILQQIDQVASSYQSRFHPINLLKKQIEMTAGSLSEWNALPRPPEDNVETKVTWQNPPLGATVCEAVKHLVETASFNCKHVASISLVQPFEDIKADVNRMLAVPIHTLHRSWSYQVNEECICTAAKSREGEKIRLLRRLMSECLVISHQVQLTLHTRYAQWQNKELRSRQRKTYMRTLDSVPLMSSGLRLVILLTIVQLYSFDELSVSSVDKQTKLIKMLKKVLQCCENLHSFTAAGRNKWDEACSLTEELLQVVHTHLSVE